VTCEPQSALEADQPVPAGEDDLALRFYPVTSSDGTKIQAWTNDADGPVVLLCNGLGTNPYAWPALLKRDCGVRVISWNHRGVGGSQRPADPDRVGIDAFVEDAVAVLDDAGVGSCVVAGWSIGVNTGFELAITHPERVTGLFAVAGVPGGTFTSVGAPLFIPRIARRPVARGVMRVLEQVGPVLTPVTTRLPVGPLAAFVLQHSGLMLPGADPDVVRRAVRAYLDTPVEWGMHLARIADEHPRVSLRKIQVPTTFIAGRHDMLASAHDMGTAAVRIPDAEYVVLNGSHFIQMEHPEEVHGHLLALLERVQGRALRRLPH
jgi:pimeloyl-ACP methyl ester carboxylesterase